MKTLIAFLVIQTIVSFNITVNQDAILGKWITEEGKSVVEVFKNNNKYFAKILWLKEPNDKEGKPKKDTKNPSKDLKNSAIVGLVFLKDFEFNGKDAWEKGSVYDPESGNTYSGNMKLKSENILELRGYMGISMLGRTSVWVRKN